MKILIVAAAMPAALTSYPTTAPDTVPALRWSWS